MRVVSRRVRDGLPLTEAEWAAWRQWSGLSPASSSFSIGVRRKSKKKSMKKLPKASFSRASLRWKLGHYFLRALRLWQSSSVSEIRLRSSRIGDSSGRLLPNLFPNSARLLGSFMPQSWRSPDFFPVFHVKVDLGSCGLACYFLHALFAHGKLAIILRAPVSGSLFGVCGA